MEPSVNGVPPDTHVLVATHRAALVAPRKLAIRSAPEEESWQRPLVQWVQCAQAENDAQSAWQPAWVVLLPVGAPATLSNGV